MRITGFFTMMILVLASQCAMAVDLQDLRGKPRQISDYTGNGKWLVVMIWASDCLVCSKEAAHYEAFFRKHQKKDAMLLGISVDGVAGIDDAKRFVADHKLTFPNLVGDLEQVAVMVGDISGMQWVGTPTFLIYNPAGELKVADSGAVPVPLIEKYLESHRL